jgi:hypothetical protein
MFDLPSLNIPIGALLIVFGAYMLFYVFYSVFNIYHLIRYGMYGFGLYVIVTAFTGGTILLVGGSAMMLMQYDWSVPISITDSIENYDSSLFPNL